MFVADAEFVSSHTLNNRAARAPPIRIDTRGHRLGLCVAYNA
jgi:hypothetical protein